MAEPVRLPLLTNSRAKAFRRCARFHLHAYQEGYRPLAKAAALGFGGLFHHMLEAWLLAESELRVEAALAKLEEKSAGLNEFDRIRLQELMLGYDARWGTEPLTVERVEAQFECELRNPESGAASRTWKLGGKVDAIVTRDGRPWLMEHKTTGDDISPGSTYWRKLRIDSQVSTYFLGAASLGYDVEGCIYDVIRKPKLQRLEATPQESRKYKKDGTLYASQRDVDESPEGFRERFRAYVGEHLLDLFQRGDVTRVEEDLADAGFDLWQTARLIREAELAGRHPRNPDACFQWSRECEYFGVCTGAATLDDTTRFRKVESANEELDNATDPATAAQ
jgi:hypothetical protein